MEHQRRPPRPARWKKLYAEAVREPNADLRWQLIMQAQSAILQRAMELEDYGGSDAECITLEEAAECLARMKVDGHGDGGGTGIKSA